MTTTTAFKGYYGTTTDGIPVRVVNESIDGTLVKVRYCQLNPYFAGGGTLVGRNIITTNRTAWMKKESVSRNRKGQNGTLWG